MDIQEAQAFPRWGRRQHLDAQAFPRWIVAHGGVGAFQVIRHVGRARVQLQIICTIVAIDDWAAKVGACGKSWKREG